MKVEIGDAVKRDREGTRAHVVESIVAGDVITRCGKRMLEVDQEGTPLVLAGEPTCKYCVAR